MDDELKWTPDWDLTSIPDDLFSAESERRRMAWFHAQALQQSEKIELLKRKYREMRRVGDSETSS